MPKTNDGMGASADGLTGIVSHATGRLSELDPERNLDGTFIDGEHPDRDDDDDNEREVSGETEVTTIGEEDSSSPGSNSSTSNEETKTKQDNNSKKSQSLASPMGSPTDTDRKGNSTASTAGTNPNSPKK